MTVPSCACHSRDAKDCLSLRYTGLPVRFGERHDAEDCACACHEEYEEQDREDYDDGRYQNGPYHGTEF